jgi:hypothetical protein
MERAEDATTNHQQERQWRIAVKSHSLMGGNMTTCWGRQEQDTNRGKGGGEGKLLDVRQRCHKRGNVATSPGKQETKGRWS